ncbi:hypothetical protein MTR67_022144 [Solanum verrucosum]|uniref:FBD domain-containing protein n=1 Tax=Solanum verrucosum TaxID=315347 RepID=A0AAF0QZG1_SOLVR|nr:hypothetical protein MTR67_022144 [Solanum verrucosum]
MEVIYLNYYYTHGPESLEMERFSNVTVNHLREIKLEGFAVTKMPEMQLMELLLARSLMLVRMLIKLDRTVAESAKAKILTRVSKIKSASPKAEVEVIF